MPSIEYYALLPIVRLTRVAMGLAARGGVTTIIRVVALTSRVAAALNRYPPAVTIVPGSVAGVSGSWVRPVGAADRHVIMYLHGGAFVTPLRGPLENVAARIGLSAGLSVFAPDYARLPEHVYPRAHDECFAVYRELVARGSRPIVVGDSTGGVLALATLLRVRAAGLPQPAICVLLSPTVDYGFGDRAWLRSRDPFMDHNFMIRAHRAYIGGNDAASADISPVTADLRGLAPIRVIVGERDIVRPEVDRLVEAARGYDVDVRVRVWPSMWHGWYVMADRLPEGRQALGEVGAYVRDAIGRAS
ncbi:MAG TPA: alpha/beta hydrolase fold domain-containing protein [Candidatus Limnocylindria bacterium]|nr:alpha/beta hydrolase fold domain-containing protein [Candidatus Limnocylindria bacterium]